MENAEKSKSASRSESDDEDVDESVDEDGILNTSDGSNETVSSCKFECTKKHIEFLKKIYPGVGKNSIHVNKSTYEQVLIFLSFFF